MPTLYERNKNNDMNKVRSRMKERGRAVGSEVLERRWFELGLLKTAVERRSGVHILPRICDCSINREKVLPLSYVAQK